MKIGVLGAGTVGSALGRGLAEAGHEVRYGVRDPTAELPERLRHPGATIGSVADAAAFGDAVLLTTPWRAAEPVLAAAGDLGGRPLLDATNPIGAGMALTHGHDDSGAEQVQRWAPTARVVKVFNTTGVENMVQPRLGGSASLMLACGDDPAAVQVAVGLASDLGFEALPFGPLSNARLLEPLALVWIKLAVQYGQGRDFALGLLRR